MLSFVMLVLALGLGAVTGARARGGWRTLAVILTGMAGYCVVAAGAIRVGATS